MEKVYLLGGIAVVAQAIPPIATWSVSQSVCLSVCLSVCHIHAFCLNQSTDLGAIWQTHLWGLMTRCVIWGPWSPRGKRFGG